MAHKGKKGWVDKGISFGENSSPLGIDSAIFGDDSEDDLFSSLPEKSPTAALSVSEDRRIRHGNFELSMTGLEYVGDELTHEEWLTFGKWLNSLKDSIQWMIGDWANMAEAYVDKWTDPDGREFETRYAQLLEDTDYAYGTLRKFAMMSAAFPMFRRRNTLSFSHHVEVRKLAQEQQDRLLNWAEQGPNDTLRSVRELREKVQSLSQPKIQARNRVVQSSPNKDLDLLTTGYRFVQRPPKRNDENREKARRAAELYRRLAQQLDEYAHLD